MSLQHMTWHKKIMKGYRGEDIVRLIYNHYYLDIGWVPGLQFALYLVCLLFYHLSSTHQGNYYIYL